MLHLITVPVTLTGKAGASVKSSKHGTFWLSDQNNNLDHSLNKSQGKKGTQNIPAVVKRMHIINMAPKREKKTK